MRRWTGMALTGLVVSSGSALAQSSGPLSIEIKPYQSTSNSRASFRVVNSTSTEYNHCSIELGDRSGQSRWFLPNPTVLDANGRRSYPTFLFRDREQVTPPTAKAIRYAVISCSSPGLRQEFQIGAR